MLLKFVAYGNQVGSLYALARLSTNYITTKRLSHQLIPLKSIAAFDLGESILHLKENGSTEHSSTDILRKGVIIAKVCFFNFNFLVI